jgi:hypothetical protein
MTYDINEHYGVTISQTRAGRPFVATGEIFSRRTMKNVGIQVRGEGRTWSAAADRALAQARIDCPAEPPEAD